MRGLTAAQLVISLSIIFPFWGVVYFVLIYGLNLDADVKQLVKDLMIQVVPIVTAIIGYWVGTSAGSRTKDQTIATMASKEKAQ